MCDICNITGRLTTYDGGTYCPPCLAEQQEHDARIEDLQRSLEPHLKAWLRDNAGIEAMHLEAALVEVGDRLVEGSYSKALIAEAKQ
jgi:hypothetical protein